MILKYISMGCIVVICYIIGWTVCDTFDDASKDFVVGMIFGALSIWAANIIDIIIGD